MRWKATVAYDGTDFHGWQSQVGGNTVQDMLEGRLRIVLRTPTRIHGSGRTDSGVHARGQVFHFDARWTHPKDHLMRALRTGLPASIQVRSVTPVSNSFHARYSAVGKRYIYHLYEGYAPPHENRYCWSLKNRRVDRASMRAAARMLIGLHDFSAFASQRGDRSEENPVKDLRRLDITGRGPRIRLVTEATGYLYKMVRALTGALVDVGIGKLTPADLDRALKSGKRTALIQTAPPQGLFLDRVFYTTLELI